MPPIRYPVQVRRAPDVDEAVTGWEAMVELGRGDEARRAAQRLKELRRLEALLSSKPFLGRNVPKALIPRAYGRQGVRNLFRNDLPDGWRLLHTFVEVDGVQAVILLVALPHDAYDKLFGYKGR